MSDSNAAKRSVMLKCAIFAALFIAAYIASKFIDSHAFKLSRYVVLAIAGIVLFHDVYAEGLKDWKSYPLKNALWVLGGILGITVAQVIGAIPQGIFYPDYSDINSDNVANAMQVLSPLIYIPVMGILGPIAEEVFFRLLVVHKLRSKIPVAVCIILSALLFTCYHMHAVSLPEFVSCLPHGASGAVFAFVMAKRKNLVTNCAVHVVFNLMCLLVYSLGPA